MKKKNIYDKLESKLKNITEGFFNTPGNIDKYSEMIQVMKISNINNFGTAYPDFEKLTIKEKIFHGWMRPVAMASELVINGRWDYWTNIRITHEVENKPIPKLNFHCYDEEFKLVSEMIKDCLSAVKHSNGYKSLELFIDWLLYAWGSPLVKVMPPEITDELSDYWYRNFKAQYMFAVPGDYFVKCASELYSKSSFNSNAFFPTPAPVVDMMTKMLFGDNHEKNKYSSVNEPCCGSGIMLLYASNYSLRLTGQDIDPLMCKISNLNGYFFVPWLVETDEATDKLLNNMYKKYSA